MLASVLDARSTFSETSERRESSLPGPLFLLEDFGIGKRHSSFGFLAPPHQVGVEPLNARPGNIIVLSRISAEVV